MQAEHDNDASVEVADVTRRLRVLQPSGVYHGLAAAARKAVLESQDAAAEWWQSCRDGKQQQVFAIQRDGYQKAAAVSQVNDKFVAAESASDSPSQ